MISDRIAPSVFDTALDELPFTVAIIEETGTIVATNQQWRDFAADNGGSVEGVSAGTNYFDAIDPDESESAARAKDGIETLLSGDETSFGMEYPCHSPDERRWFRLLASSFEANDDRYVVIVHIDVTARREREEELRETQVAYEDLFHGINDAVFVHELDGEFVAVNETACERLGYDEGELTGMSPADIDAPEYVPKIDDRLETLQRGDVVTFETVHVTRSGDRIPVEISSNLIEYFGTERVLSVAREVSDRKRHERELRRQREFLEEIQAVARVGGWQFDVSSETVRLSEELFEILALPADDDVSLEEAFELYHPEDRPTVESAFEDLRTEGEPFDLEVRIVTATGEIRWARVRGEPRYDDEGELVRASGSLQDVTETKRRERKLERYRNQYDRMVERAPLPIIGFDSEGDILMANASALELVGAGDRSGVVGRNVQDYVPPDHRDAVADRLERVVGGEVIPFERHPIVREDGDSRDVVSTGVPDESPNETAGLAFLTDVTDSEFRKRAFERLYEVSEEFLKSETRHDISSLLLDFLADFFDLTGAAVFLYDRSENVLQPAVTDWEPSETTPFECVDPGEGPVGRVFVDGEATFADDLCEASNVADSAEGIAESYLVPLEREGVLVLCPTEPNAFSELETEIIGALTRNGSSALERIEMDSFLESTTDELDHHISEIEQLEANDELLERIMNPIMDARTRSDIIRSVGEILLTRSEIIGAWVGEPDTVDDTITVSFATGNTGTIREGDQIRLDTEADRTLPAVEAFDSGTLVEESLGDPRDRSTLDRRSRQMAASNIRTVLSLPMRIHDTTYGVLTVYSCRPELHRVFRHTIERIAEIAALAINSVERQQSLAFDRGFELTFHLSDPDCVAATISRDLGCRIRIDDVIDGDSDSEAVFLTAFDADPTAVRSLSERIPSIAESTVLQSGSSDLTRARVTVVRPLLWKLVSLWGGNATEIVADGDSVELTLTVPNSEVQTSVRQRLIARFPEVTIQAKRQIEDRGDTDGPVGTGLLDQLTDRQQEVFKTAYHAGYFDSPRDATGEDVAELLGISSQAFYQHVRTIQRKLASSAIDPDRED